MGVNYNIDAMIADVKRRAAVPSATTSYTDTDFAAFLNEAMWGDIVPIIMQEREEYLVESIDYEIVANQARYQIPQFAIGNKLRSLERYQANQPDNFVTLAQVKIEQLGSQIGGYTTYDKPVFYMEGSDIVLYPTPTNNDGSYRLRMRYFRRPNELVPSNQGAVINVVDNLTGVLSLASIPATWQIGTIVDIVRGRQPFNLVAKGVEITNVSGTDVTFALSDIENVQAGDTIALEGFAITPNISMPEAHQIMKQAAVARLHESLGNQEGLTTAIAMYNAQLKNFRSLISDRVDSAPKKVVPRNDYLSRRWRFYY